MEFNLTPLFPLFCNLVGWKSGMTKKGSRGEKQNNNTVSLLSPVLTPTIPTAPRLWSVLCLDHSPSLPMLSLYRIFGARKTYSSLASLIAIKFLNFIRLCLCFDSRWFCHCVIILYLVCGKAWEKNNRLQLFEIWRFSFFGS